ncbi:21805_t:CDS:2, partial [Entrophospora sp. SA101]
GSNDDLKVNADDYVVLIALNDFIDSYQTNETIQDDRIYKSDGEDYEKGIPEHLMDG